MSCDWPTVRLGELADITSSKRIKRADYVSSGVPFFRSKEVIERSKGNNISTELFISEEHFSVIRDKFGAPEAGDILLTSVGTLGVPYQVRSTDRFYFKDGNLTWLRRFQESVLPEYVLYWLRSPVAQRKLDEVSIGSTQRALTIVALKSVEIPLPPKAVQARIVDMAMSLDQKLETNRAINQTLEQIAQAIFKSWFVDFEPVKAKIAALEAGGSKENALLAAMQAISGKGETELTRLQTKQPEQYAELRATAELFPSAMQDSELGEIPEGWECLALDQIAKYQNGLALQKFRPENEDDYLPVVKIAQLKKGYADHEEKASPNIKPDCIIDNGDVVFSWSGSLMVDTWCGGRAALNQHLFKVTSENYPKWLYFHFTRHHLEEFQRIAADKAVTMGHIKREHLKRALCAIPDGKFIESAGKVLSSVLNKQIELRLESKYLSELRDALLPKLLSGELSVSETANQTLEKVEPTNV